MQELEDGLSMLEGEIEDKEHATQLMRWVLEGEIEDKEHASPEVGTGAATWSKNACIHILWRVASPGGSTRSGIMT